MITKAIEIRDAATFIPALAIRLEQMTDGQAYLVRRAGFEPGTVIVLRLDAMVANYSPADWGGGRTRTMEAAHEWLQAHFHEIEDGAVVDVQFILGERATPKRPEREEYPL